MACPHCGLNPCTCWPSGPNEEEQTVALIEELRQEAVNHQGAGLRRTADLLRRAANRFERLQGVIRAVDAAWASSTWQITGEGREALVNAIGACEEYADSDRT
jgi:hypothetical protein